ncbi:uncharacterized protein LOC123531111 isoform X2 [Mercenaria mercenaria]|uniref:uncharacterized protein LOC123531111 isoform X2 n=1 Tax=Mercenaria mercenaria TaxID=6596 RepID=UPI00234F751F|nr:uncharacterized protein LOC123531111 isoform X2 [Mercenaria mercenaria]
MRMVVLIYMSAFILVGVCGFQCLECDDVLKPTYCDTVTRCGIHEQCYVDAKLSTAGSIRYSLGCRDSSRCSQTHNVAKRDILHTRHNSSFKTDVRIFQNRRSGGNWVCSECCSGDLCNSAGCGSKGYPSQRGPICFNCPQQNTEDDCNKITMCGQDELCMLHKTMDPVIHETFYESRCEGEQKCNDQLSRYKLLPSVLVGKRRRRNAVIYHSCRLQCCKTSLCNANCTNESIIDSKLSTDRLSAMKLATRTTTRPNTSASTSTTSSLAMSTSSTVMSSTHQDRLSATNLATKTTTRPNTSPNISTTSSTAMSTTSLVMSSTHACNDVLPECASTDSKNTICLSQVLAAKYCRKSCGYCSTTSMFSQSSTVSTNTSELCQRRWSPWINNDSPSTGDGDRESWTKAEQHAFCPNGNVTSIECVTQSGIHYYSSGDITDCTPESGSVCLTEYNFPVPCSDYKIRYLCTCDG